jgi:lipopolysaccharide/colanic/teichoic acid biosynthesis glycosyltransferase
VSNRALVASVPSRSRKQVSPRRSHVINEELFRGVLIRERKRADRSNQPFLLLLLSVDDQGGANPPIWPAAIEALKASRRDTDVLGWFSERAMLGVILPEIVSSDAHVAREIEVRVRRELSVRLHPEALARMSIRLHVHPEPKGAAREALSPVEPLLQQLRPRGTSYDSMKRGFDILGSLALLLVLSPLLLLIAALMKLTSRGPVFFRQARVGQQAKPFTILKFRTMNSGADHAPHHQFVTQFIKSSSQIREPGRNAPFKIANDPRVTPIGRILRKTSFDELPQLWNVLRGDMSLVGPRPPLQYEVEQYEPWHCRRVLESKPGITGLWQVSGRSRTTFDDMVRLDLQYARTCSLWTDIKILLATPAAVISGKGAC